MSQFNIHHILETHCHSFKTNGNEFHEMIQQYCYFRKKMICCINLYKPGVLLNSIATNETPHNEKSLPGLMFCLQELHRKMKKKMKKYS